MDGCWMVHFIAPADIVQLMATGDGKGEGESIFPVRTNDLSRAARIHRQRLWGNEFLVGPPEKLRTETPAPRRITW